MTEPLLLEPIELRGLTARNRIVISPMCQYSADDDGCATDWHLVHLGQFALGGAGIVFTEATAIEKRGRISHYDTGLWDDSQIEPFRRVTRMVRQHGALPAVQLSHTGRKGSSTVPWRGAGPLLEDEHPWPLVGPSAVAADGGWPVPTALSIADILDNIELWRAAAKRADAAGFEIVEIHGGHGYLVHQFLSPTANQRNDEFGGDLAGRMRFALMVADAVRSAWPDDKPVFFRVSAIDGDQTDWSLQDSIVLSRELKARGVDVVDCSSGGITGPTSTRVTRDYGFQTPYAAAIRAGADIKTCAVGLIVDPFQANAVLEAGSADLVAIAREALNNPYWARHAEMALKGDDYSSWPIAYSSWLERRARLLTSLPRPDWKAMADADRTSSTRRSGET